MTICKSKKTYQIIAIDGPAGAGKSTVAKLLAKKLKFLYLDTGAMYRALTLAVVKARVNFLDADSLAQVARKARIELKTGKEVNLNIYLDGRLVNKHIRSPLISSLVSFVARQEKVRKIMVRSQRAIGQGQNCVVEGRDIGTVVFPHAKVKFYLDASLSVRGTRRFKELKERSVAILKEKVTESIFRRDRNDLTRAHGPLKKASDALYVDTSNLSINQVVDKLLEKIYLKLGA